MQPYEETVLCPKHMMEAKLLAPVFEVNMEETLKDFPHVKREGNIIHNL